MKPRMVALIDHVKPFEYKSHYTMDHGDKNRYF